MDGRRVVLFCHPAGGKQATAEDGYSYYDYTCVKYPFQRTWWPRPGYHAGRIFAAAAGATVKRCLS